MKPPVLATPAITIASQDVVWSGRSTLRLVTFNHRRFDASWSNPIIWELWQRGVAAAMLPYDPVLDRVVLIEQFRLPSHAAGFGAVMREIPAGMCEPGEDAEHTIRRELVEEAGIEAGRMFKIGDFLLSAGASDETIKLYAGEVDATRVDRHGLDLDAIRDDSEDIRVLTLPATDAIADAIAGRLPNSVATIGLLWLAARRDWLRAQWA